MIFQLQSSLQLDMKIFVLPRTLLLALFAFFVSSSASASLTQFLGVDKTVDNAAEQLRESITHTKTAISQLIREGDNAVGSRIADVDAIVQDSLDRIQLLKDGTTSDIVTILQDADTRISRIQRDVFNSLDKSIRAAECAAGQVILRDAPTFLGSLGEFIGANKIRITPPVEIEVRKRGGFICLFCDLENEFRVRVPFDRTYIEIRDYMLNVLDNHGDDELPAFSIVSTYSYIADLARKATCFTQNQSSPLMTEHIRYVEKANSWSSLLSLEIR